MMTAKKIIVMKSKSLEPPSRRRNPSRRKKFIFTKFTVKKSCIQDFKYWVWTAQLFFLAFGNTHRLRQKQCVFLRIGKNTKQLQALSYSSPPFRKDSVFDKDSVIYQGQRRKSLWAWCLHFFVSAIRETHCSRQGQHVHPKTEKKIKMLGLLCLIFSPKVIHCPTFARTVQCLDRLVTIVFNLHFSFLSFFPKIL